MADNKTISVVRGRQYRELVNNGRKNYLKSGRINPGKRGNFHFRFLINCNIMQRISRISFFVLIACSFQLIAGHSYGQSLNTDSVQRVIDHPKDDTTKVNALYTLANYLIKDRRKDSTGWRLIQEGARLSQDIDYQKGIAQGILLTGSYYSNTGKLAMSMDANEQLIRYAGTMDDEQNKKLFLRAAYNNLGGINNRNGDYASSLENRLKSISVIESMEKPSDNDIFIATYNAASDFRQLKQYDKAREYLAKIEPLLPSVQPRFTLEFYYEYYQMLVSAEDHEKARQVLHRYDSSLKVLDLSPAQRLDFTSLSKKLHGLYEMEHTKNYAQALIYFNDELLLAKELGNPSHISGAEYNYAWALFYYGNYPECIKLLENNYRETSANGRNAQAQRAASLLSRAYAMVNRMREGYDYARIALDLQDTITQEDHTRRVNFLEAKYQHEKKEKELADLQRGNDEKEYQLRRKNWFILGIAAIAILLALLAASLYRYYKNKQKLMKQEKNLQEEKLRNMEKQQQVASLQAMINGQESERTRIARDLHDGLGGLFSTVKMHYSTLQEGTPAVSDNPVYRKTMDLINSASDELRRVAHNMMPEVLLKVGLNEALQDLCNNITAGKLLRIKYQGYGMERRLAPSTEIMVYRIIQELVNNIIKHSGANEAIIQINRQGNRLNLTIEDNGRGFDTLEAEKNRSLGMATVRSRVDYLNGHLSIDSRKDLGTTVMIDILLNEN